ncbi:MAG TPA: LLM class flavin-dependent oxidoreductase [Pirellulales bacterium]|jgi:alkanesulfonate monooxygenase SsuD/methylene tetrahydromethanopterin reductase-like flavin-dependent oxidoreductase (luciferase family)|nr:LLM class flavin-dependent oxidoreductase [Pirellulales bacterium]
MDPIRWGMFVMPIHPPAKPLGQCYDEDLELLLRCEELGASEFWVGEHHSSTYENIVMPEIFIAKAFGMTKRIRLGPAPVCLQYHHPLHVAGRLAFLDHLSHGRLNVCFGPGAIPTDMEGFGIDPKDTSARVAEAIEMVLALWTIDPPYQLDGQFWQVRIKDRIDLEMGLGPLHKPLQRPHPPIAAPCISRNSPGIRKAGERGFLPFSHHMVGAAVLADHWKSYCYGAETAGRLPRPADWRVARNVFVAETTDEARRTAKHGSLGWTIEYILELTRRGPGLAMWKRDSQMTDAECNLDYFLDEVIIAGDPQEVVRRLRELRGRVGDFGTLVLVAHDWDDPRRHLRSLELFANEVVPAL